MAGIPASLAMQRSISNSSSSSSDSEFLAHELMGPKSAKDLDTLRALAQAKKKRKYSDFAQATTEASQQSTSKERSTPEEGELEDGEIGDMDPDSSTSAFANPASTSSYIPPLMAAPSATFAPAMSQSNAMWLLANADERRQTECNAIITELLSWGVTPEYLVGYGISKDLLVACLISFGHPVPPHLAHLIPPGASTAVIGSPPRKASLFQGPVDQSPNGFPLPYTAFSTGEASSSAVPDEALADLEAKRRAMLLARKQAMAQRNTERAKTLHSEIDNLFALTQAEIVSDHDSGSSSSFAEEIDMAIDTPIDEPTTQESMFPLFTPAAMPSQPHATRRPKASDLEAEPTHSLPQHPKRNGVFVPPRVRHSSLVIEVSDGEDEGLDGSDTSERKSATEQPISAKPKLQRLSSTSSARSAVPDKRVDALSTKEQEIKRMMEMIKRMEEKKKLLAKNSDAPLSRGTTPVSGTVLSPQSAPLALASAPQMSEVISIAKEESPAPESLAKSPTSISEVPTPASNVEDQSQESETVTDTDQHMQDVSAKSNSQEQDQPTSASNARQVQSPPVESAPTVALVPPTSPEPALSTMPPETTAQDPEDAGMDVEMEDAQSPPSLPVVDPANHEVSPTADSSSQHDPATNTVDRVVRSPDLSQFVSTSTAMPDHIEAPIAQEASQPMRKSASQETNSVPTRFVSYRSPLHSWSRQPLPASSSAAPMSSTSARPAATPVDLQMWMAKKAGMDANAQLCRFEIEGNCNDPSCSSAHVKDLQPSGEDLVDFFVSHYGIAGAKTIKLSRQGISLLANRYVQREASGRNLPSLLLNVHNFVSQT